MHDIRKVLTHEGVIALYQYERDEHTIPVLVVRDHSAVKTDRTTAYDLHRYYGLIVLTLDDIDRGDDAFALTFAHIQKRSIFVGGAYDIIGELSLQPHHIRMQMEVLARQLLIDAREQHLRGLSLDEFYLYLSRAQDRLSVGFECIGEPYDLDISTVPNREELIQNLLAIVDQIDTLDNE